MRVWSWQYLSFGLLASKSQQNKFPLFKGIWFVVLCYGTLKKPVPWAKEGEPSVLNPSPGPSAVITSLSKLVMFHLQSPFYRRIGWSESSTETQWPVLGFKPRSDSPLPCLLCLLTKSPAFWIVHGPWWSIVKLVKWWWGMRALQMFIQQFIDEIPCLVFVLKFSKGKKCCRDRDR